MRHSVFVPFLPPHKAIRDSTIEGYHIPKDTTILINLWHVHADPREWQEPDLFNPERVLDDDRKFVGWDSRYDYLPFGAGRRACLGETMAKQEVFTVASKVLQRFCLHVAKGEPRPTLEGEANAIRCPNYYTLVAEKRE